MRRALLAAAVVAAAGAWQAGPGRGGPGAAELVGEADAAMAAERWDEALRLYGQARPLLPQRPEIPFNMGVAAYRAGDLARAAELFGEARLLADDPALRARAAYNQGTTAFRRSLQQPDDPAAAGQLADATRELTEALQRFREAIDANPADVDARANGELAQRWLEQLQQMQQQQQQQGDDGQRQDQPQQDQQRQQQNQQQGDEARESRQEPAQHQQPQASPQEKMPEQPRHEDAASAAAEPAGDGQAQPDERETAGQRKPMSREEARRRLQAVRDRERQRREELARREAQRRPPVEKDW